MGRAAPKFLDVPHRDLRSLGPALALACAACRYRARRGLSVDAAVLSRWLHSHRTTAWRHLVALRDLGRLDQAHRYVEPQPADGEPLGSVRVSLALLQQGDAEAVALSLLATWNSLRMVRVYGAHAEVRAAAFAKFLGVCSATASSLLRRLAAGCTTGVRRRGAAARRWLEVRAKRGRAAQVRLLGEREGAAVRQRRGTAAGGQQPPPPRSAPPDLAQLLAIAAAAAPY